MIGPRGSVLRNRELWLRERAVLGEMISSFDIAITWVTPKVSTSCVTRSLLTSPGRHRHIVPRGTLVRAELLRIRISNSDGPAHFVIAGLDPAIHLLRKHALAKDGWIPGSSPIRSGTGVRGRRVSLYRPLVQQTRLRDLAA